MEIVSNRISATPRSKYVRYGYEGGNTNISGSGSGSANIDLSNYVKLTGETEQTIEGNVLATGDIIAYSTGQSVENYPIASSTALGTIKVGQNLTIDEDGTLNAQVGGGTSNWNEIQGKPTLLTDTNIQKWDDNSHTHLNKAILDTITADSIHTHSNKSYLDSINQNLSKTSDVDFGSVKATGDIIAYSTGQSTENYPIASSTALGCIKVGNNLSITSDGTLSAQAGGVTSWNELKDKPTTLAGYGITDAAKASDLTSHTGNTTVHITATERTNWSSAYSNSHTHTNKTTLDGISSTNVSNWNTAYNNAHSHSNKTYLDNINQNLSTSSTPNFSGGLVTGSTSGLNIQHSSGNSINGRNGTSIANLYFNYSSASKNVLVDSDCNIKAYGDVIAYSTGTASAPFKYWKPSVNSSGDLSWTNSTSETIPTTVNIKGSKGDKGDKGDTGKSVGKVSAYSTSSASGGSSVYRVYDTSNSLLGSFTVYNGQKGEKGDKGATGATGATGSMSASSTVSIPSSGTTFTSNSYNGLGVKLSGGNGILGWNYSSGGIGNLYINNGASSALKVYITNYSAVSSSDIRLKTKFYDVPNVLDKISNISAFYHTRKDEEDKILRIGVSAQDVKEVFPELVQLITPDNDDSYYAVDYITLATTVAINGCKELYQLVKNQQAKIDELEQRLAIIESNNNIL